MNEFKGGNERGIAKAQRKINTLTRFNFAFNHCQQNTYRCRSTNLGDFYKDQNMDLNDKIMAIFNRGKKHL